MVIRYYRLCRIHGYKVRGEYIVKVNMVSTWLVDKVYKVHMVKVDVVSTWL